MPEFAFIDSPLDRSAALRNNPAAMLALRHSATSRCVSIKSDTVAMADDGLDFSAVVTDGSAIFLGRHRDGRAWFATTAADGMNMQPLRGIMLAGVLPREELAILAQARSLVHWHESHGFCARCGQPTQMADQGYRRHCGACASDHFPRTDPVVIMAVLWQDKVLLGRQASWNEGMYSALAGFVEPGETIEDAVRREIREEAGVDTEDVRYLASQPWPFPSTLMIGAIARAKSDILQVDTTELQDARWFSSKELRQMLDGNHPEGLFASHPYAIARHIIEEALKS